ncbi:MAG: penicillin-binding protein 2 [Parvularculaceae bacterium]
MRVEPYDTDRQQTFSRRAFVLGGATSLVFVGIGARLYQLQVLDYEDYALQATENQFNWRLLPPLRGEIIDRFGAKLATNRRSFRVMIIPEEVSAQSASMDEAVAALSRVIQIDEARREKILREARTKLPFMEIEVEDNLGWDEFARINFESPLLPGVRTEVGETRYYPLGPAVSSIVGYVGPPSADDIVDDDPLFRHPAFRIGKKGVESAFDEDLRGESGRMRVEVNAHGKVIRELREAADEPKQGETLILTIDAELQQAAMEQFEGESGAAVVMDVETGEIIVLASAPGFDPNDFNLGISQTKWRELTTDPYQPLVNKAVSGTYPPGSTFKLLTALTALETGVIDPDERVSCNGRYWFGNRYFHCWRRQGHGPVNLHDAIKKSCDVYFYEVSRRLEIDAIHEVATKFGLGQTFDVEIPNQSSGIVPSTEWKRGRFNEPWYPGETLSIGIGQGYLTANALQLAVMTSRIANGGYAVAPKIVRYLGQDAPLVAAPPRIDVKPEHLELVRKGMDGVTNEVGGTARRSALPEPEFRLAGKTGTSQVRRITAAERAAGVIDNEDLPWNRRDHALFVAFAPYHAPRYAISVIVQHGGGGSSAAGPRAREIMRRVLEKDPLARMAAGPGGVRVAALRPPIRSADQT